MNKKIINFFCILLLFFLLIITVACDPIQNSKSMKLSNNLKENNEKIKEIDEEKKLIRKNNIIDNIKKQNNKIITKKNNKIIKLESFPGKKESYVIGLFGLPLLKVVNEKSRILIYKKSKCIMHIFLYKKDNNYSVEYIELESRIHNKKKCLEYYSEK